MKKTKDLLKKTTSAQAKENKDISECWWVFSGKFNTFMYKNGSKTNLPSIQDYVNNVENEKD